MEKNSFDGRAHRDICVKRIRTDFSTLLMLVKGRPERGAGVHSVREDTTIWTKPGLILMRLDQLFKMADIRSGFLQKRGMSRAVRQSYKPSHRSDVLFCV